MSRERAIALGLLVFAAAYAALASRYTVAFVADPLGPRAAPLLLATLLAILAIWILATHRALDVRANDEAPYTSRRVITAIGAFALYGALLPWLGFVLANALLTAVLARLIGGPPLRGAIAGGGFAAVLYYLFVFALDVPLPIGRLFPFLGG